MRATLLNALLVQGIDIQFPNSNSVPVETAADNRFGPNGKKLVALRGDFNDFDPNRLTWLGGICSLTPGDSDLLRRKQLQFATSADFQVWFESWYPRIDQVHDCVGIPPKACKSLIYVVEDSIWGRRIAAWTGLPLDEVIRVLRETHQRQGARVIEQWLRKIGGYGGEIRIVYSSELEAELEFAIRLIERMHDKRFKGQERDYAKVRVMYTPMWLEILGINSGVIVEPMHHLIEVENGVPTHGFYQIGYVPYWTSSGPMRLLPSSDPRVTHFGNWKVFVPEADNNWFWPRANHFFSQRNPLRELIPGEVQRIIANDLKAIYRV